jgi:hypothetical protein
MRTCAKQILGLVHLALAMFCIFVLARNAAGASFTWDASPDAATGKVLGYKFYYSTQSFTSLPSDVATNPNFTILTVTNGTTVNVTNMLNGLTYFMAVTAFGTNNQESLPSNILTYTVGAPTGPVIALTSPAANVTVLATDTVTVTATASSSAAITKVDFFDGAFLLTTKTASPYSFASAFTAGAHVITAKVTDANNATALSGAVTITSTAVAQNPANVAPTVAISSPANNSSFAFNSQVTITATAADSDGTIASVDFFDGATSLGSKTTAPYSIVVSTLSMGAHTITARATDNVGAMTTSAAITVNITANQAPTVVLTAPANNASFMTNDVVTISATASDPDGTIAKVEFFDGATLLGTFTTAPYTTSAAALAAGTHTITAKATDNMGASTTSTASTITVNANQAPTVALTSPNRNSSFFTTDTLNLTANASDVDGTIAKVEFFDGATLLGTATASPYSATATGLIAGSHTLTAKATDNKGAVTTSKTIPITIKANAAPTVALTSPAANATFIPNQVVTISATASDTDGTVARVDFYDGATLIGSRTATPYSITTSTLVAGTHTITAKAVDDRNGVGTSAAVSITIRQNSLPAVALANMAAGALLSQPVVLTANASDSDGTIASVEFFANDASLGVVTASPFTVSLPMNSGTYTFKAKATDNDGGVTVSDAITAVVKPTPPVNLTVK